MTYILKYDSPQQTPAVEERAIRALLRGVPPKDVAEVYGVGLRTAYRWRNDVKAIESVRVAGWVALFVIRHSRPPSRISEWRQA